MNKIKSGKKGKNKKKVWKISVLLIETEKNVLKWSNGPEIGKKKK